MYAKLFSRIAQSSLMEEEVETRYCFMMLLAICDSGGDVIGTDVAIARTVNLPLDTFKRCIVELMKPDPDSNSQALDGRRIIESDAGRGYKIVNYLTYRAIKSEEEKKTYMRDYMRARRKAQSDKGVTDVKICKTLLSDVTQGEGELEGEVDQETKATVSIPLAVLPVPEKAKAKKAGNFPTTTQALRIAAIFARRPTTAWSDKEVAAFKSLLPIHDDDLALVERFYAAERAKGDDGRERRDLITFLNNFAGESDKAKRAGFNTAKPTTPTHPRETPMDKMLRETAAMLADGVNPDQWRADNAGKDYQAKTK